MNRGPSSRGRQVFGALAVASSLMLCSASRSAAQAGPPYPRLANVYLHGSVDPADIPALARWNLLVLDSVWSDAELRALRTLNPDIKLFYYVCPYCMAVPPAASDPWRRGNYDYAQAHDMWWRNTDGSVASDWPGTRMVNVTDHCSTGPFGQWRNYFSMQLEVLMNERPALDGVFLDNFWKSISWEQGGAIHVDSDCSPSSNPAGCDGRMDSPAELDAQWNHAMTVFAGDVRRRFDRAESSRRGRPLAILSNGASDYFPWINGTMYERFAQGPGVPDPGNRYGYKWMAPMFTVPSGYLAAPFRPAPYRASILNAGWTGTDVAPFRSAEFERHKRFTLASALLGDGYYSLDAATAGHGALWWEPEYDHAGRGTGYLGYPKGPAKRVESSTIIEFVVNGSFTNFTAGWTAQGTNATGTFERDWTVAHSGPGAARMTVTAVQPGGSFKIWQTVPVLGGTSYVLSFWAKANGAHTMTTHLYSDICPNGRCLGDQEIPLTAEWQHFEVPFLASANSLAGLNFFLEEVGTIWVDDVSLRSGEEPIYRRDFDHGVVLLNYTSETRTVDLGRTYYRLSIPGSPVFNGAAVRVETVPPSDARILVDVYTPSDAPPQHELHGGLLPNEPNPFRPGTDIRFGLARAEHVLLVVYDIAGRRVRTLVDGVLPERADHHVHWDGADDRGQRMAAGIYVARLRTPTLNTSRKMTLLR